MYNIFAHAKKQNLLVKIQKARLSDGFLQINDKSTVTTLAIPAATVSYDEEAMEQAKYGMFAPLMPIQDAKTSPIKKRRISVSGVITEV